MLPRERVRSCGRISEGLHETYSIECEAGRGMYGVVFKGLHREQGKYFAIKKFKTNPNTKESDGISISACREILLLRELNHANVVWLEEIVLIPSESSLSLVFDYAEYDLQVRLATMVVITQGLDSESEYSMLIDLQHDDRRVSYNITIESDVHCPSSPSSRSSGRRSMESTISTPTGCCIEISSLPTFSSWEKGPRRA